MKYQQLTAIYRKLVDEIVMDVPEALSICEACREASCDEDMWKNCTLRLQPTKPTYQVTSAQDDDEEATDFHPTDADLKHS